MCSAVASSQVNDIRDDTLAPGHLSFFPSNPGLWSQHRACHSASMDLGVAKVCDTGRNTVVVSNSKPWCQSVLFLRVKSLLQDALNFQN
ncbi:hypothetical protein BaRGS_00038703 [Batillaria attramentaria]|uniref:Uncharacterized protein n=1 Tax=Batillaria attramentaria TaxID=370345 RepID=A0ABD0J5J4_9CAEN